MSNTENHFCQIKGLQSLILEFEWTLVTGKETVITTTSTTTGQTKGETKSLVWLVAVVLEPEKGRLATSYRSLENVSLFCGEFQFRKRSE